MMVIMTMMMVIMMMMSIMMVIMTVMMTTKVDDIMKSDHDRYHDIHSKTIVNHPAFNTQTHCRYMSECSRVGGAYVRVRQDTARSALCSMPPLPLLQHPEIGQYSCWCAYACTHMVCCS